MEKDKTDKSTDWKRLENTTDEEIERMAAEDPHVAPVLTDDQMKEYKVTPPKIDEDDYANDPLLKKIVWDDGILGGKPRIDGRRISVQHVLDRIAMGWDFEKIMQGYDLTREEVVAAVRFAAWKMGPVNLNETLPR